MQADFEPVVRPGQVGRSRDHDLARWVDGPLAINARRQAGERAGVADQDRPRRTLGARQNAEGGEVEVMAVGDERRGEFVDVPPAPRSGWDAAEAATRCRCRGGCSDVAPAWTAARIVGPSAAVCPRATTTPIPVARRMNSSEPMRSGARVIRTIRPDAAA